MPVDDLAGKGLPGLQDLDLDPGAFPGQPGLLLLGPDAILSEPAASGVRLAGGPDAILESVHHALADGLETLGGELGGGMRAVQLPEMVASACAVVVQLQAGRPVAGLGSPSTRRGSTRRR